MGLVPPTAALVVALGRHNRELRRVTRRLQALSTTDALTGIPNRRRFDEQLAQEMARTNRYATPVAVVMIDLDHFKELNDRFGHPAGDEVLRQVAGLLDRQKRVGDLVARIGGEEFAALLPHADLRAAAAWAERMRRRIAEAQFPRHGHVLSVTASFGVAAIDEPPFDPGRLVEEADRALYSAKHLGRNRVISACASAQCDLAIC